MSQVVKEEREGISWDMGKSIPGRENSLCKGPEVRTSRVAESEGARGRVGQDEGKEVDRKIVQGLGGHEEDFGFYLSEV